MPSPFPGMDPWLEESDIFPDLHNTYIAYLREVITKSLPREYYSSICNRIYMEDEEWHREPDVNIHLADPHATGIGGVATAVQYKTPPVLIERSSDPVDEWYMEIRSAKGNRLVTAAEVLSSSNKRSASQGRAAYLEKQDEYLSQGVNLVEIDFLRDGLHTTSVNRQELARQVSDPYDYHVCVTRQRPKAREEVYPIVLGQSLPTINIPLLAVSTDVQIDLQGIFNRCYDAASYDRRVDYTRPPEPRLSNRQAQLLQCFLKVAPTQT